MPPLQVILVEDDPMVQELLRQFIEKIDGFTIVGTASNGAEGLRLVRSLTPDLAIIDLYMPHIGGMEMVKGLRSEEIFIDTIIITAARDIETIHKVLQQGALDYIIKPFTYERIKKSLENYRLFRLTLNGKQTLTQQELDELLAKNGEQERQNKLLPKGLNSNTLIKIIDFISNHKKFVSADDVAEHIGIARVTARRYLDYLEKEGKVRIHVQYGGIGRPVNRYGIL